MPTQETAEQPEGPASANLSGPAGGGWDSDSPGIPAADGQRGTTPGVPAPDDLRGISLAALLRRHWLLAILLAAGLTLRVLAQIAYRPALLYIDSLKYL